MKTTIGLLTAVQTSLAKEGKYSPGFGVQGAMTSAQAQRAQSCPLTEIIADARVSASKLASAAGLTAGAIAVSTPMIYASGGALGGGCSVTVKFSLGGI